MASKEKLESHRIQPGPAEKAELRLTQERICCSRSRGLGEAQRLKDVIESKRRDYRSRAEAAVRAKADAARAKAEADARAKAEAERLPCRGRGNGTRERDSPP